MHPVLIEGLEGPLRAYADVERIFAFERKIKPMLKTLKTEVRAAKAAKDAAAREMDDFDRSVRRRVARDVLGIFPGQLFLHVCGGCIFSSLVVWYCVRKREKCWPLVCGPPRNAHGQNGASELGVHLAKTALHPARRKIRN